MIISFSVKNFHSIKDKLTISFEAGRVKQADERFRVINDKVLSTVMVCVGANASGKTTVLKALSFLLEFMFDSFFWQQNRHAFFPFKQHFFSEPEETTEFELEFFAHETWYRYSVEFSAERVLKESLRYKKTTKFFTLFDRKWDAASSQYLYQDKEFGFNEQEAIKILPTVSVISTAAQYGVKLALDLRTKSKYKSNIGRKGRRFIPNSHKLEYAADIFYKDKALLVEFNQLIPHLDLGLDRISINKIPSTSLIEQSMGRSIEYDPIGHHSFNGKEASLSLLDQSEGTKTLFWLCAGLLPILKSKDNYPKIAIIDELEADLHPDMMSYVLNLFLNPQTNPHGAQIIFTSHNQEILLDLDKSQVALVEKSAALNTEAWRLSDMEGIRPDDNIYKKYKSGAYGARPKL